MIYLYSGSPGSGKSLHTATDIMRKLRRKHNVICNFSINMDLIKATTKKKFIKWIYSLFHIKKSLDGKYERSVGDFIYKDNSKLTVEYLLDYARKNHRKGKEGQTLIIIDECSVMFNPREFARTDRNLWIKFFQLHRHLGYNVILISQNDRLIDRQIRSFIEYDVKHRCANNFGTIGLLFTLFRMKLFVAVTYWYGVREKCGFEFFTYRKFMSELYDSYANFSSNELLI